MYHVVSKSGWRTGANTREEAIAKAEKHFFEWLDSGVMMPVSVYYYSDCILTLPKFVVES